MRTLFSSQIQGATALIRDKIRAEGLAVNKDLPSRQHKVLLFQYIDRQLSGGAAAPLWLASVGRRLQISVPRLITKTSDPCFAWPLSGGARPRHAPGLPIAGALLIATKRCAVGLAPGPPHRGEGPRRSSPPPPVRPGIAAPPSFHATRVDILPPATRRTSPAIPAIDCPACRAPNCRPPPPCGYRP